MEVTLWNATNIVTGPVGAAPPPDGFGLPGGQPAGARWGSPAPPPVYLRVAFHNVTSIGLLTCVKVSRRRGRGQEEGEWIRMTNDQWPMPNQWQWLKFSISNFQISIKVSILKQWGKRVSNIRLSGMFGSMSLNNIGAEGAWCYTAHDGVAISICAKAQEGTGRTILVLFIVFLCGFADSNFWTSIFLRRKFFSCLDS